MKAFPQFVCLSPGKAATVAALSLLGLTAFAAAQPGPVTAIQPAVTGAHAGAPAPVVPEEDILDIRGPIHIPAPYPWAAWAMGSLAISGVALGAWALLRSRHRRLPYELALEDLAQLRPLMQPENAHAFSLAVSGIVRLFIEDCLSVRAAHRTTHEFLRDLLKLPDGVLSEYRGALEDFLTHCDLAKFARWALTVPQMEAMLASASAFVVAVGKPKAAKMQPATPAPEPASEPVVINS
jgi:hypothetical protein